MSHRFYEVNFDGLVGPTHNYAGLALGNLASSIHRYQTSQPRAAALQGLRKMKWVSDLGLEQAVLPPQFRPDLSLLRELGFSGTASRMLDAAWKEDPVLVAACYSASSMWTANAATVSPSPDCRDGILHLTPANLVSGLHRSREATEAHRILSTIFSNESHFNVHTPLPSIAHFADEGAANHTRFCSEFGEPGVEFFVYGRDADPASAASSPRRFPARQTRQASRAVARRHQLRSDHTVYAQQSATAIDQGVFHNDVIAVGHRDVLFHHEDAFEQSPRVINELRATFESVSQSALQVIEVKRDEVSLEEAVRTYLFNSQLLSQLDGSTWLLCPSECEESSTVSQLIQQIIQDDNPIMGVQYVDLRQSMNNGGGPACLRLRVVLSEPQLNAIHPGVRLTESRYTRLEAWIETHYREELQIDDLRDPALIDESRAALDELSGILEWPAGFLIP